jgi:esterase FrsA
MPRLIAIAAGVAALAGVAMSAHADDPWQVRNWDQVKAETQARAERGAYPVIGIKPDDARDALAQIHSLDHEEWGAAWIRVGDRYAARADAARQSDPKAAQADYRSAWALYNLGRWPVPDTPNKALSYAKAQKVFQAYGALLTPAIETVRIPFEGKEIVGFLQKPAGSEKPPLVINIAGSDLWKDYAAIQTRPFLEHGIASFAVDMPGTGDAPLPVRPGSERMYSAIIDYVQTRADLDGARVIVRGQSWGSYWSARVGFAEAKRLKGVVFQSGPVDLYFQKSWQEKGFKTQEFLFDYVPSRLHMLGVHTVEEAFEFMPTLSLMAAGLIDKPTPPMLLIGGYQDTQVPFDDFLLLLSHGSPKHAWVNPAGGTMGRSLTIKDQEIFETVVLPWVRDQFTRK